MSDHSATPQASGKSLDHGEAALIAVFGALWGLMEITIGTALKGMRLPMSGMILAMLAAIIALTGYYFVPRRGAILMMGGVAALLKVFSVGTVIAGPFFAILIEALVADGICSLLGRHLLAYLGAGAAMLCYTALHPFITQGLLFGGRIYEVYVATARQVGQFLHLESVHLAALVGLYLLLHLLAGAAAGFFAFRLARAVKIELHKLEHSA